jgi:ABC-type antimicrobial peptide transport system permease subunit
MLVHFALDVYPLIQGNALSAFAAGLAAALIGAVGGFWPALRAARLSVVDSLREA